MSAPSTSSVNLTKMSSHSTCQTRMGGKWAVGNCMFKGACQSSHAPSMPRVRRICRLAGTPFIVDTFWQSARDAYSFQPLFFLTHFHADHVAGLRDGWDVGPLYCSAVTAALLRDRFPGLDAGVVVCCLISILGGYSDRTARH